MSEKIKFGKSLFSVPVPTTVAFEVTPQCNQRCVFCYNKAWHNRPHPSFKRVTETLKKLINEGVVTFCFTGGEPLTYPYLEKAMKLIQDSGCYVMLTSNGIGKKEKIKKISKYVKEASISIMGPDSFTHNSLSMTNTFDKIIENIKFFMECNIQTNCCFTATSRNYQTLTKTAEMLSDLEVKWVGVNRFIPAGQGIKKMDLMLNKEQLNYIVRAMDDYSKRLKIGTDITETIPRCLVDKKFRKFIKPCCAGIFAGCVDFEGNVKHCGISYWKLGNIFDSSLESIWNNKIMNNYRSLNWIPDKCKKCKDLLNCAVGCRVSSSWLTKKPYGPDIYLLDEYAPIS